MKTLKELKGKSIEAVKTITCDEQWQKEKIAQVIRNIQPQYYNDTNAINIKSTEIKNGHFLVTVTCDTFIAYSFDKNDVETIKNASKSIIIERIEKINRYKMTATGFEFTFDFSIPLYEQVKGVLSVTASGAYVFNGSHGDVIKATELLKNTAGDIIGFFKRTYAGEKIEYNFI